jgi:sigma-E factor negative regulatory protein RseB
MASRATSALTLICATLALAPAAWGTELAKDGTSATPARDVRGWLMRIHDAASRRNFQGTFVVSGGGNVASARMSHFCEGSNQYERIESLDGKARNVFRHNDVVHTVWPASRVAVVEQRDLLSSFPALLQAGADNVGDRYELRQQDDERVAGHAANVLLVQAKDAYRYGYRLWSDKASGLLLRADVLSARGEVLETSAFSDISIGVRSQPESVLQAMKKLDGYRVLRPVMSPTSLETEGWMIRQVAPGFRQIRCVSREMENAGDVAVTGGARRVLQTIYADGMTYVSVFIEPYKENHRPTHAAVGATQTLSMRQGDWWITVIGDVPAATLQIFAGALERKK